MSNIIILRGPYCSGKTTWASKYCQKHADSIRLAPTELAVSLASGGSKSGANKVAMSMFKAGLLAAIGEGKNIIIDGENFLDNQVKNIVEIIDQICIDNSTSIIKNKVDYQMHIKYFSKTPLDICIERNKKMQSPRKESSIIRSYKYFHERVSP